MRCSMLKAWACVSRSLESQAKQGSRSCSQRVAHKDDLIPRIMETLCAKALLLESTARVQSLLFRGKRAVMPNTQAC